MVKIVPVEDVLLGDATAVYHYETNTIYYDKRLDDFPVVKDMILTHELEHAKKPLNYFHHFWIDTRDYFNFSFNKEVHEFSKATPTKRGRNKPWWAELVMIPYLIFISIYSLFLSLSIRPLADFKFRIWRKK